MKLKFFFAFICFYLSELALVAQVNGLELPTYTIHSPSVRSLGQYGEYQVDLSTGVPQISIPLYTIKTSRLEIPVSLSYHASGIKVDQEASFVGLGWVLQAGGNVTRIVRDIRDEFGFIQSGKTLPDYNPIFNMEGAGFIGNSDALRNLVTIDKEPDLFILSAIGVSNQFCLDNGGKYTSLGLDSFGYQVDLGNNLLTVRDRLGTIYRFGKGIDGTNAFETTGTTISTLGDGAGSPGIPSSYSSSWHLTAMISADLSDTITFTYKTGSYTDTKVVNTTRYILNDGSTSPPVDGSGRSFDGTFITTVQTSILNLQIPDKIIFKNGYLQFSTADDRIDLDPIGAAFPHKTRITGFTVYDENNNIITKVNFQNADYFDRTGTGTGLLPMGVPAYHRKGLKLNAVQFFDKNNVFVNDYKFEYDNTPLPPRNTTSQDHWGYYNGKNNSTLIPQTFFNMSLTGKPTFVGESRRADYNFMKAGVLNKITFPTGGYTVYDFEANAYLTTAQSSNLVEETKSISTYAINRLPACDPDFLSGVPADNIKEFTVTDSITNGGVASLYVYFTDYVGLGNPGVPIGMTFKITNLSRNESFFVESTPGEKNDRKIVNTTFPIRQGDTYRIEAKTNGVTGSRLSICNSPYLESRWTYTHLVETDQSQIVPEQAGGLRVKTISVYNSDNKLATKKAYEYGDTWYRPGVGKLITDPSKYFYNYPLLYTTLSSGTLRNVMWFTSESQVELGLHNGCPVDYDKVVETVVSNDPVGTNGKTEYHYNPVRGDYEPKSSYKYPYLFIVYPSWKQKTLKEVVQYKTENGSFVPVASTSFSYIDAPEKRIKTVKLIDYQPDIYSASRQTEGWFYLSNNPQRFYYYNYYVSRGKVLKSSDTTKMYVDGIISLVTNKTYQYNGYLDLSKESLVNSKSQNIENIYKYTADLNYSTLVGKNMVSLPVQQEQWLNGKAVDGTIIKYDDNGQISERYTFQGTTSATPVSYTNATLIPAYYEKKQSLIYDPVTKNIQEIQDKSTVNTIYLWSYKNLLPIAEIRNTDLSTVQAVLGASSITNFGNKNPTPTEISTFLAPLRTDSRLSKTMITTYTHKPSIGVTSITDTRGLTTFYEFDDFSRLKLIKDNDGKIVKLLQYQYKASVDNTPLWEPTNNTRCKPCPQNGNYITNIQQLEEKDTNPQSATYNQTRWTDAGTGTCVITPDWQNTGAPICLTDANGYRTGIQRTVQKDMNPCSPTYNQTRNSDVTNTTACLPNAPNWQNTGNMRCKTCPGNSAYTTDVQQNEQKDMNPNSATYNQLRWIDLGPSEGCTVDPGWTNTSTPVRCKKNFNNENTGEQEQEQKALNPCGSQYNQTRWKVVGTNTSVCPVPPPPCTSANCPGPDRKCINGTCTNGVKRYFTSVWKKVSINNEWVWKWECTWKYCFPDGTEGSTTYTEYKDASCATGGCLVD